MADHLAALPFKNVEEGMPAEYASGKGRRDTLKWGGYKVRDEWTSFDG
jgi:hypothetical protein